MAVGDNACEASGFSLAAQENDHVTRLWEFSAGELADLIRTRQASCLEVVDAHLERIWSVNPRVNALTNVMTDQAREAAQEADRRTMSGDSLGPLHGIPFTVKENIDVAGTATTWGVSALQDAIADSDAPLVANLRSAGAIPIGRTNMPDFALRWHTDNGVHGATVNPWDMTVTPGGSSGGNAAALATGMTPLGMGKMRLAYLPFQLPCNLGRCLRPCN